MIVSDSRKFVFFHVPKTGGTSVDSALGRFFDCAAALERKLLASGCQLTPFWPGAEGVFHANVRCKNPEWADLSTDCLPARFLLQVVPEMADKVAEYFVFTVVRNPYDRSYSRYLMWQRYGQLPAQVESFTDFLMHTRNHRNQLAYLPCLRQVDYIARTETLARDFAAICDLLDLGQLTLPEVHVATPITRGYRYLNRYTPEAIELVNRMCADEFRLLDYPMFSPESYLRYADGVCELRRRLSQRRGVAAALVDSDRINTNAGVR